MNNKNLEAKIDENFHEWIMWNEEQIKIMKELEKTKSTIERVKLFDKIMDDFWVDAVASLIPWLWDTGSSLVSTLYLLSEWKRIWISMTDSLKIMWYQTADIIVWAIPVLWDIADYFFKANKRSGNLFNKYFDKLKQEAINKWISKERIEDMDNKRNQVIDIINTTI